MAALGVASLIGASVAGVLVDRFDPRRVVLFGELLFIPVAISLVFADTVGSLVITTFLLGLVGTPVFTAVASFAPFLTADEDRLSRINGLIEGRRFLGGIRGGPGDRSATGGCDRGELDLRPGRHHVGGRSLAGLSGQTEGDGP